MEKIKAEKFLFFIIDFLFFLKYKYLDAKKLKIDTIQLMKAKCYKDLLNYSCSNVNSEEYIFYSLVSRYTIL